MSDNPELGTNPQKEAILARCPYTKILLDSYGPFEYEHWSAQLLMAEAEIDKQLKVVLGDKYITQCIIPLALHTFSMEVFNPKLSLTEFFQSVKSVIYMGFEVGNLTDCTSLIGDLTFQLFSVKAIDKAAAITPGESKDKVGQTLVGLFSAGIHYRSLIDGGIISEIPDISEAMSARDLNLEEPPNRKDRMATGKNLKPKKSTEPPPSEDDRWLDVYKDLIAKL